MSSQKSTRFYESSSFPKSSATKNSNELISTIHPTFISSPDTSTRLADNGTLTKAAIHSTNTEHTGLSSENTVQETKDFTASSKTLGPVNGKKRVTSSVVTTLGRGMSSQKSGSFYGPSSVPKSSATKNSNELISTIHPTFISSPDTSHTSTRLADNGTLTTAARHSTNIEDTGVASPKTLGPVNGKTRTTSSLPKKLPALQKLSTTYVNTPFLKSISSSVQTTNSDVKTHQTEDPVSTSKKIVSHTNSARLVSGTPRQVSTSVDRISDINQTRDVTSSVTTVGSLVNISTSPTVRKTSHHFLTAVHTLTKPSSRVVSVILTSNKDVPSSVSPTSPKKDIVSNWTASPYFISQDTNNSSNINIRTTSAKEGSKQSVVRSFTQRFAYILCVDCISRFYDKTNKQTKLNEIQTRII